MADLKFQFNAQAQSLTISEDKTVLTTLPLAQFEAFVTKIPVINHLLTQAHANDFANFLNGTVGFGDVKITVPGGIQITLSRKDGTSVAGIQFNPEDPSNMIELDVPVLQKLLSEATSLGEFLTSNPLAKMAEQAVSPLIQEAEKLAGLEPKQ